MMRKALMGMAVAAMMTSPSVARVDIDDTVFYAKIVDAWLIEGHMKPGVSACTMATRFKDGSLFELSKDASSGEVWIAARGTSWKFKQGTTSEANIQFFKGDRSSGSARIDALPSRNVVVLHGKNFNLDELFNVITVSDRFLFSPGQNNGSLNISIDHPLEVLDAMVDCLKKYSSGT